MNFIKNKMKTIFTVLFFCLVHFCYSAEHTNAQNGEADKPSKFNPSSFIFDHIGNSHEWHILTYKDKHVSIYLPVILYSKVSGVNIFSSSKFHHGHEVYNNFKLQTEGDDKGKIVELHSDGTLSYPFDISITKNVFAIFVSMILLFLIFISIAKSYGKRKGKAPKGLQSFVEPLIMFIRDDVAKPCIGHKYNRYMPFLLSIFFFIFINNLLGLVPFFPGGANVTGNISVTLTLAVFSFFVTTFTSNKGYWVHIFNTPGVPWWLKFPLPLMPIIELMGVFTKPIVLMIRLFANITAGHIIVLGFLSLIFIFGEINMGAGLGASILSITFSVFMTFLELLVAFIQAYVFTMLSAIYFGMANVEEHH
jgi:F-type H+-transporting ATPase subunit a